MALMRENRGNRWKRRKIHGAMETKERIIAIEWKEEGGREEERDNVIKNGAGGGGVRSWEYLK